jgi:hypothetical protein
MAQILRGTTDADSSTPRAAASGGMGAAGRHHAHVAARAQRLAAVAGAGRAGLRGDSACGERARARAGLRARRGAPRSRGGPAGGRRRAARAPDAARGAIQRRLGTRPRPDHPARTRPAGAVRLHLQRLGRQIRGGGGQRDHAPPARAGRLRRHATAPLRLRAGGRQPRKRRQRHPAHHHAMPARADAQSGLDAGTHRGIHQRGARRHATAVARSRLALRRRHRQPRRPAGALLRRAHHRLCGLR